MTNREYYKNYISKNLIDPAPHGLRINIDGTLSECVPFSCKGCDFVTSDNMCARSSNAMTRFLNAEHRNHISKEDLFFFKEILDPKYNWVYKGLSENPDGSITEELFASEKTPTALVTHKELIDVVHYSSDDPLPIGRYVSLSFLREGDEPIFIKDLTHYPTY